jgi:TPR repeat protein
MRAFAFCAALILGATVAAWPAVAGFEEGVRAYLAQDYETALKEWRPLAEQGNAPAQFGMGLSYENGRGVERDPVQAAIWYRKAAEQDLADAQFNLGNLYLNAVGVPKDPVEAVRWFRRAAEQDMPHAQVNLGYSYETGSGVAKDPVKAVSWYRRAADQDFPQAQYYLGAAYDRGSGVEADLSLAAAWYKKAADHGVALAGKRLDELLSAGVVPGEIPTVDEEPQAEAPAPAAEAEEATQAVEEAGETNLIKDSPKAVEAATTETTEAEAEVTAKAEEEAAAEVEAEAAAEARAEPAAAAPEPQPESAPAQVEEETQEAPSRDTVARAGERVATLEGSFRLRLASYRKPENAEKGWSILTKKYGALLTGLNYAVAEADLGAEKGIYHRLEAGPIDSLDEAKAICAEITSRGDSCVVVRP